MRRSLHREKDLEELKLRILNLKEDCRPKWGRMDSSQMLTHCRLVLEIPLGNTVLPKTPRLIRTIGIITKKEMELFNNGIPPNMPTFTVLKPGPPCDFHLARQELLHTIDSYGALADIGKLPAEHALFGKMEPKDWGFLEYKHLNHHLNQFGI